MDRQTSILRYFRKTGKLGGCSCDHQDADLSEANLQDADLSEAKNLTSTQIKSACSWQEAIYRGMWNYEKKTYVATEPDNTNFIEELKKDKSSYPRQTPDCSLWEQENDGS